jgi:hypothetical protein
MVTEMKRARTGPNQLFWWALICCTVYQSYRYPFQINSTLTSPTYSDTPFILQAGKFLLACPFLVVALPRCFRTRLLLRQWVWVSSVFFLFAFAVFKALAGGGPGYVEPVFWMPFALAMVCATENISIEEIDRYLRYLLIYALSSTAVELLLFIFFGRLPALAYEGTVSIRFGGFLDDPNGFAGLLFLLLGWCYARYTGRPRALLLISLTICLLLTQSWTALGFFAVIVVGWGLSSMTKRPVVVIVSAVAVVLLCAFALRNMSDSAVVAFQTILDAKQKSAQGHAFPWSEMLPRWAEWLWFGQTTYTPYESWWAGALVNFGLPWLCINFALYVWITLSLRRAFVKANATSRPMLLGLLLFALYFVFGSVNLPFPTVFPLNVILFMFSFPLMLGKIRRGSKKPEIEDSLMPA